MARTASAKNRINSDIIVIGGGLAGLTMTAVLGRHGFNVTCIDREKVEDTLKGGFDGRTIAVSYGSRKILEEAGVWQSILPDACPIEDIRILDGVNTTGRNPVLLSFLSSDADGKAFGWIVESRNLRAGLLNHVNGQKNVTHVTGTNVAGFKQLADAVEINDDKGRTYTAKLVIGADGRNSIVREWLDIKSHGWNYDQTAIVCCVAHEHPHNNVAVEHFQDQGPFAILPMTDNKSVKGFGRHRSGLVWTRESSDLHFLDCEEDVFNAALQARFPADYGHCELAGQRFSYPLSLQHAKSYIGTRMVLIAEAAHAMHPIAGQGLNMGMRDIGALSDLLIEARDEDKDFGAPEILKNFQTQRRFDTFAMMAATDGLNKLFSNRSRLLGRARRIGVRLVEKIPPAKRFFMAQAMGTAGFVPNKMKR